MNALWDGRFAERTEHMTGSAIRELLKFGERPELISFAGGMPATELFPVQEFGEAYERMLVEQGANAFQYGATEGYRLLREMIARHTARYGLQVTADNILITSGSQQALDLLGMIFIDPGDRVVVESPTYLGALQAWNAYGPEYVTVKIDDEGMQIDALERALSTKPKFIYVLPNFQNPTGTTLSFERRVQLVELAKRYDIPIVEDDPYGQLRFEGEHVAAVSAIDACMHLDREGDYRGNVIYLSTFSKILAPGLRVGWVIAPTEVIRKLVMAKQGADLQTSTLCQMLTYQIARGGFLDEHVKRLREVYRQRRDAMFAAMEEHFPICVEWTRPEGGLFIWATMPEGIDAARVLQVALAENVAFVPGASFHADNEGTNALRLNFSNATPAKIHEGIARLGRILVQQVGEAVPA